MVLSGVEGRFERLYAHKKATSVIPEVAKLFTLDGY